MSASAEQVQIPDGFRLHTENTSHILLSANEAFLNPVQEFNRDLSIACIRTWSEDLNRAKEEKRKVASEKRAARKRLKRMSLVNILPCIY
jgi:tRNA (guanine26-N2/guanine27-N2)-dimethyltransferase